MLTRRIFLGSKHIHGRMMTNSILEEEAVLASVVSLCHVPTIIFHPECKTLPCEGLRYSSLSWSYHHPPYPCAGDT